MTSLPAKTCSRCGELKTLTSVEFSPDRRASTGFQSACKACYRIADNARSAARQKYYQDNKESITAVHKKYYENNRESRAAVAQKWYQKNKEASNAYGREYAKNNRDKYNEAKHRRRARMLGNGVEKYTTLQVLETYGIDCHLCNRPVDMSAPRGVGQPGWETGLHIDHVIPISKGGQDTLVNVRPSHGYCNVSKGARLKGEF